MRLRALLPAFLVLGATYAANPPTILSNNPLQFLEDHVSTQVPSVLRTEVFTYAFFHYDNTVYFQSRTESDEHTVVSEAHANPRFSLEKSRDCPVVSIGCEEHYTLSTPYPDRVYAPAKRTESWAEENPHVASLVDGYNRFLNLYEDTATSDIEPLVPRVRLMIEKRRPGRRDTALGFQVSSGGEYTFHAVFNEVTDQYTLAIHHPSDGILSYTEEILLTGDGSQFPSRYSLEGWTLWTHSMLEMWPRSFNLRRRAVQGSIEQRELDAQTIIEDLLDAAERRPLPPYIPQHSIIECMLSGE